MKAGGIERQHHRCHHGTGCIDCETYIGYFADARGAARRLTRYAKRASTVAVK